MNLSTRLRSFCTSAFRLAAALTMTAIAISAIGFAAYWAYMYPDREQAKQAEIMRSWANDMSSNLGMKVRAKTKVTDSTMHIALTFDGHPDFLKFPANFERGFFLEWKDADGFSRIKKFVKLSEFTTVLNDKGKPYGLNGQFSEFVTVGDYINVVSMEVGWNLKTEVAQPPTANPLPAEVTDAAADHCAPGLSRQERLRRLAQHGQVRQTGMGEFTAAGRVVHYLGGSGELYECR